MVLAFMVLGNSKVLGVLWFLEFYGSWSSMVFGVVLF